jgi:hypothetical protein
VESPHQSRDDPAKLVGDPIPHFILGYTYEVLGYDGPTHYTPQTKQGS